MAEQDDLVAQAKAALEQSDVTRATELVSTALWIEPDHYEANLLLGWMLAVEAPDLAIEHVQLAKAVALDPTDAYLLLIECLLAAGDRRGALQAARDFATERDENAIAHERLARVLLSVGVGDRDNRQAYEAAYRAVTLDPSSSSAWVTIGDVLLYVRREASEAAKAYDKALAIDPLDSGATAGLAAARREVGDVAGALSLLNFLAGFEPADVGIRGQLTDVIVDLMADFLWLTIALSACLTIVLAVLLVSP